MCSLTESDSPQSVPSRDSVVMIARKAPIRQWRATVQMLVRWVQNVGSATPTRAK